MTIINLFGGPGTGKSTVAAEVFSKLKRNGINAEYVNEYMKDKAWEYDDMPTDYRPKIFAWQEYIFAKQFKKIRQCNSVDVIVTDSPTLLGLIYMGKDYDLPSMRNVIIEAHNLHKSVNIFLNRVKPYNPKGRFQTEEEAIRKDKEIKSMLIDNNIDFICLDANEQVSNIIANMI